MDKLNFKNRIISALKEIITDDAKFDQYRILLNSLEDQRTNESYQYCLDFRFDGSGFKFNEEGLFFFVNGYLSVTFSNIFTLNNYVFKIRVVDSKIILMLLINYSISNVTELNKKICNLITPDELFSTKEFIKRKKAYIRQRKKRIHSGELGATNEMVISLVNWLDRYNMPQEDMKTIINLYKSNKLFFKCGDVIVQNPIFFYDIQIESCSNGADKILHAFKKIKLFSKFYFWMKNNTRFLDNINDEYISKAYSAYNIKDILT